MRVRAAALLAAMLGVAGLALGFLFAPTDAQQGGARRIICLRVPVA
jgi:ABC-type transport system involved in cytochrome c biogenesis permease subunit